MFLSLFQCSKVLHRRFSSFSHTFFSLFLIIVFQFHFTARSLDMRYITLSHSSSKSLWIYSCSLNIVPINLQLLHVDVMLFKLIKFLSSLLYMLFEVESSMKLINFLSLSSAAVIDDDEDSTSFSIDSLVLLVQIVNLFVPITNLANLLCTMILRANREYVTREEWKVWEKRCRVEYRGKCK